MRRGSTMAQRWTRRDTLKLIGTSMAVYAWGDVMGGERSRAVLAADEFDTLRLKWRDLLTGGDAYDPRDPAYAPAIATLDNRVRGLWERMNKTAGRKALWSEMSPGTSETSYISTSYLWLAELARAYATKGSMYAGNGALLGDIIGGLDWLYDHEYNE